VSSRKQPGKATPGKDGTVTVSLQTRKKVS
jgi:hypothetical protein